VAEILGDALPPPEHEMADLPGACPAPFSRSQLAKPMPTSDEGAVFKEPGPKMQMPSSAVTFEDANEGAPRASHTPLFLTSPSPCPPPTLTSPLPAPRPLVPPHPPPPLLTPDPLSRPHPLAPHESRALTAWRVLHRPRHRSGRSHQQGLPCASARGAAGSGPGGPGPGGAGPRVQDEE
jgi:hypothetical protein